MDEYLDIVDEKCRPTGETALKSEAHAKGLYHNTIHLWLYTTKGEILLQQRSHKKIIFPLLWDVSVAGHIDAGETFIEAVIRETEEEIGLKLEVEALKLVALENFEDLLKHSKTNMHFVASNYDYYLKVHKAIQNKLLKL